MAKISKRIANSYESYLSYRQQWHDKGYGLDRELTINEYARAYIGTSNKNKNEGKKHGHVARDIASGERTFGYKESIAIMRRLKTAELFDDVDKEGLEMLREKYRSAKSLRAAELTPDEMEEYEQTRREYYEGRGVTPEFTIQSSARQKIFNELLDIGLSYKEADEVMYG